MMKQKFKSLRRKVIFGLLIAFAEVLFITYFVLEFFLMKGILEVEKQYAYEQKALFENAILTETQKLITVTSDWAPWDETYEFIGDGNKSYIDKNLMDEAFVILDLDYFIYLDSKGKCVFEKGFDPQLNEQIAVPSSLHDALEDMGITRNIDPTLKLNGLILLPEGPVIISTHPIMTSNFEGPIRGNLIAVRSLNEYRINQIGERFMLDIALSMNHDEDELRPVLEMIDAETLFLNTALEDIEGNPSIQYTLRLERDASHIAAQTVRLMIIALLIAFLIIAIGNLMMLDKALLQRLVKLSHDVKNIGNLKNASARLEVEQSFDEISIIRNEMNVVLDKLEDNQESLIRSEEKFRTLVENGTDVLFSLDYKGKIAYISPNCIREVGFDQKVLTGKSFEELMHPDDRAKWNKTFEKIERVELNQIELEFRLKKGDNNWYWFHTKLIQSNQNHSHYMKFIGVLYDDDKRKKAEEGIIMVLDRQENIVRERTEELLQTNEALMREINERKKIQQKFNHLAYHDHLTGLPNRLGFKERMIKAIEQAQHSNRMIGVVFLDLDSFKIANDTLGHNGGNELIKAVGERISKNIREYDTLSRVGGDEFLIMIQNISNREDMTRVLEGIISLFNEPFHLRGKEFVITASAGVALYPTDGLDVEELIRNADIAMYHAKKNGKNQYFLLTETLVKDAEEKMRITGALYHAMENNELEVFYQPQVDALSGNIVGVEALLRWHHPEFGYLSPNYFIPIAEVTGLIHPIGEWVLRTACMQNLIWQNLGLPEIRVAVNMSVQQIDIGIVERVKMILEETGLSPEYLEIEITESVLIKENEIVVDTIKSFKKLGVTISIDDFGTEYSSLCRLRKLPIDRIKIDMNFVQGIGVNYKDEAIAKSIVLLAKSMDLIVIAEGVETSAQEEFLKELKCDEFQGFYFYRPMPADEIKKILETQKQN